MSRNIGRQLSTDTDLQGQSYDIQWSELKIQKKKDSSSVQIKLFNGKRHIVTIKYKRFLVNNIFE